ncbi:MAG: PH domain-containing protein, partial [Thermoleophilia bacterium]|nr:PH domain-containing protein [Thermoleophilia bacterium]
MKSLTSYLGEQETTLLAVRQHPLALTRAAREMVTFVVPLLITAWGLAGVQLLRGPVADWGVRLCFALVLGFVLRMAWRVLQWEFERVVITDEKVIHIEGVLQRRIASTPLAKVSEFTVRQSLLGRIFGYGRLVVDVPGGRDQALHGLNFIPD